MPHWPTILPKQAREELDVFACRLERENIGLYKGCEDLGGDPFSIEENLRTRLLNHFYGLSRRFMQSIEEQSPFVEPHEIETTVKLIREQCQWYVRQATERFVETAYAADDRFEYSDIRQVLEDEVAHAMDRWIEDFYAWARRKRLNHDRTFVFTGENANSGESADEVFNGTPPDGYVCVSDIMRDPRFSKGGKNPPRTTIQKWIEASKSGEKPVKVVKARDNQEVHLPEAWVNERISHWNPRKQRPSGDC